MVLDFSKLIFNFLLSKIFGYLGGGVSHFRARDFCSFSLLVRHHLLPIPSSAAHKISPPLASHHLLPPSLAVTIPSSKLLLHLRFQLAPSSSLITFLFSVGARRDSTLSPVTVNVRSFHQPPFPPSISLKPQHHLLLSLDLARHHHLALLAEFLPPFLCHSAAAVVIFYILT